MHPGFLLGLVYTHIMCNVLAQSALHKLMDLRTQHSLIERAKTDSEAFGVIFDTYYKNIVAYISRKIGDVDTAQDIAAETFIKSLRSLPMFQWRGISVEAWLYTIATNEIRMYLRGKKINLSLDVLYEQQGFEVADDYDLEHEVIAAEHRHEMHEKFLLAKKALETLPQKYRQVLQLRFNEGKKVSEIAAALGLREGTVKSQISRGVTLVRKYVTAHTATKFD